MRHHRNYRKRLYVQALRVAVVVDEQGNRSRGNLYPICYAHFHFPASLDFLSSELTITFSSAMSFSNT